MAPGPTALTAREQAVQPGEAGAALPGGDSYYGSPAELAFLRDQLRVGPGIRLLDVACGPAGLARALHQPGSLAVGLDLARPLLRRVPPEVAPVAGDAGRMPFRDKSFDVVVTRLSLHRFLRPEALLGEMKRVTRQGGIVAAVDLLSPTDPEKARRYNTFERLRDPAHVHALTLRGLAGLLGLTGLDVLRAEAWRWKRDFEEWLAVTGQGADARARAEALLKGPLWQDGGSVNGRLEAGRLVFDQHFGLVVGRRQ